MERGDVITLGFVPKSFWVVCCNEEVLFSGDMLSKDNQTHPAIAGKFMNQNETKQVGEQAIQESNAVRLPLWKNCAEQMMKDGIDHGNTYTAEYFEERLRCKRDDMRFGLAISEIRRVLELNGFYLSGRGLKGNSFIILHACDNQDVMKSYASAAIDALKRGVILGTKTRLDSLNEEERRRHESILQKLAMRLVLCKHPKKVSDLVAKSAPGLLKLKEE